MRRATQTDLPAISAFLMTRAAGVAQATLFAAGDRAARANIGIGFQRIGQWSLRLCARPVIAKGHFNG